MIRPGAARALPSAFAVFAGLLGALLLLALALVARRSALATEFSELYGTAGLLLIAAHVALVGAACRLAAADRLDPLEPVYFVAGLSVLTFVLRPIQILWVVDPNTRLLPADGALFRQALTLGLLGSAGFFAGYLAGWGSRLAARLPVPPPRWSAARLKLVAGAYIAVGLAGFVVAVERSGGIAAFTATLRGRALLTESRSMVFAATLFLIQAAALVTGADCLFARRHRFLFGLSLGLCVGLGTLLGGRAGVLLSIVALGVMLHYKLWQRRTLAVRHALLLGLVVAFCIAFVIGLGALRPGWERGARTVRLETLAPSGAGERFLAEFNQFDWFVILLDLMPDVVEHQHGATFAQFFLFFVPRGLWEDKPLPFEYTLTAMVRGEESGSPFTFVGELFLNFGVPGVVAGMFLAGVAGRALHGYLRRAPDNPGVVLFYAATYANLLHFYTRNFAPMMFTYVLLITAALAAVRFCARPDVPAAARQAAHAGTARAAAP
jgi:oligosaccharide repeat unit polymerase